MKRDYRGYHLEAKHGQTPFGMKGVFVEVQDPSGYTIIKGSYSAEKTVREVMKLLKEIIDNGLRRINRLEKAEEYIKHFKKVLLSKDFSFKVGESEDKEVVSIPHDFLDWIMRIPNRIVNNKELKEEIVEELVKIGLDLKAGHEDVVKWVTQIVLELDASNNKGLD